MKKYILALTIFITGFAAHTLDAQAQSEPPYGMSEIAAYSIFYDNYRTGDYEMALQFGEWMLEAKPREIQGAARFTLSNQYERMINVFTEMAKEQSDPSDKRNYLNRAVELYDEAFEIFTPDEIDEFRWTFRQGRFFQEHASDLDNGMDKAFENYERAFELDPVRLTESSDGYYVRILLDKYVSDRDREKALAFIDQIEPIGGSEVQRAISDARDRIFDSPEERITFLESQLEGSPNDVEILNELATLYEHAGNRAKAIETAEKLYEIEPSFEHTRKLADYAISDARYEFALQYLKEALDKTSDELTQRNISLEIADAYQNIDNFQEAREYARKASSIDPNWGQPYLRIASIYAATISRCTRNRTIDRDDRSVYWLVLDYLDKAREADPSVASAVNRQYQTYEPVLPSSEDKFFRGWEAGDRIMVNGNIAQCYAWIDEATTVR